MSEVGLPSCAWGASPPRGFEGRIDEITQRCPLYLVVDLADQQAIGSATLGTLVRTYQRVKKHGWRRQTPEVAAAIKEMFRQVGNLVVDEKGVALRGLMIRHLVLPENISGTDKFVKWVAAELGTDTYVNIMDQYRPEHRAREHPPLDRRLTNSEYRQALAWATAAGLSQGSGA